MLLEPGDMEGSFDGETLGKSLVFILVPELGQGLVTTVGLGLLVGLIEELGSELPRHTCCTIDRCET